MGIYQEMQKERDCNKKIEKCMCKNLSITTSQRLLKCNACGKLWTWNGKRWVVFSESEVEE